MRRLTLPLGAALAACALIAFSFTAMAQIDFSRFMPDSPTMHANISSHTTKLAAATAIAEGVGEGLAERGMLVSTEDGAGYEILVHGPKGTRRVVVSATTGEVMTNESVPSGGIPGDPFTGELTTTESGLQYVILQAGDGPKPKGPQSNVKVHYSGWTVDGKQFDSSVERGQPATFPLNRVIPGWTEGVGDMKVGEKRKLVIPYNLAYGETGRPPVIPPKALLTFDVESLEIIGE